MEWTKIHTSLIVNRVPDKDILAITKYQLLWAELEHEPDESTALRYMTANQLALARQYIGSIMADVCSDIDQAHKGRNRRRKNYIKNKENNEIVTGTVTGTVTGSVTGTVRSQIREDKIREEKNIKTPLPPLKVVSKNPFLEKVFIRWLDYRKQIKKPYKSQMSVEECYRKLERLSGGSPEKAAMIVSQSIAQGWQGLFELKETGGQKNEGTDYNRSPDLGKYAGFGRKISG